VRQRPDDMTDNYYTSYEKHFLEIYRNSIVSNLQKDNNLYTYVTHYITQCIFPEQYLLYYNQAPDRYLYIMFKQVVLIFSTKPQRIL